MSWRLGVAIVVACMTACAESAAPSGSSARRAEPTLGMNDVSFLFALPTDPANTTTFTKMSGFDQVSDMIPRAVYADLIAGHGSNPEIVAPFDSYHAVAMRFDLCTRRTTGPCDAAADGELRLTFQPLDPTSPTKAEDVALHASYRIPVSELPSVVAELRSLAQLRDLDPRSSLQVNEILTATASTEYSARLRTLVASIATQSRLTRIAVFALEANQPGAFIWEFSALEPIDGVFQFVPIPGLNIVAIGQEAQLNGIGSFNTSPIADIPPHLIAGFDKNAFAALSKTDQRLTLEALTTVLNPRVTTTNAVMCSGCHLATFLTETRASEAHVPVKQIDGRFISSYNLSIAAGQSATDSLSLRMLGWRDNVPEISQRVANDTAMVLEEIETRFPSP